MAAASASSEPAPPAETEAAPAEPDEPVPPIADLLPTVEDVPPGFVVTDEGERAEDVVAASFGEAEAADAAARLAEWGWRQNLYRTFEDVNADPATDATNYLEISLHRFRDAAAAGEALPYFAAAVIGQGLTELGVDPVGDQALALAGNPTGGANLVVVYVQDGPVLIRIGGSSPAGDPTDDVVALARQIVER